MSERAIVASNLRHIGKATLVGSVDLTITGWHLKFSGCLWHRKNGREWINFAAASWTDEAGERHFVNVVEFTDRAVHDRFQAAALAAVHGLDQGEGGPP